MVTTHKKVLITGATGLVGKTLCQELHARGYALVIVTRNKTVAKKSIPYAATYILWSETVALEKAIDGAYGVINLAGSSIAGKRWTGEYKKIILASRITAGNTIVTAIKKARIKPRVFITGSAVGYYGITPRTTPYDEDASPGSDFLAQVCVSLEHEAKAAAQYGTRVVIIRTAVVLDKNDGALPRMLFPFYYYLGGPIGTGQQFFPWIHVTDEVGIICFALENNFISGPINAAAPETVTNKQLAVMIGKILHKPSVITVPVFALQCMFGEAATVLTTGVKISVNKILDLGYTFQYPSLQKALENILQ